MREILGPLYDSTTLLGIDPVIMTSYHIQNGRPFDSFCLSAVGICKGARSNVAAALTIGFGTSGGGC